MHPHILFRLINSNKKLFNSRNQTIFHIYFIFHYLFYFCFCIYKFNFADPFNLNLIRNFFQDFKTIAKSSHLINLFSTFIFRTMFANDSITFVGDRLNINEEQTCESKIRFPIFSICSHPPY